MGDMNIDKVRAGQVNTPADTKKVQKKTSEYTHGGQLAPAPKSANPVKILEDFSTSMLAKESSSGVAVGPNMSDVSIPPRIYMKYIALGGLEKVTGTLDDKKLVAELKAIMPLFNDRAGHPVLCTMNDTLGELMPKEKGAIKTEKNPAILIKTFQDNCQKNLISAKHFEKTEKYKKTALTDEQIQKEISEGTRPTPYDKKSGDPKIKPEQVDVIRNSSGVITEVTFPVAADMAPGRQTVRAMVFIYELGKLQLAFGVVKSFDEYVDIFNNDPAKFQANLLKFKIFINTNKKTKEEILGGGEITDSGIGNVRGNTGEAIIKLYAMFLAGQVGEPNLVNIADEKLVKIFQEIVPADTDTTKYPNLAAVIEAKMILFSLRKPDGKRYYDEDDVSGTWQSGSKYDLALIEFKKANGLPADSKLDASTAKKLLEAAKKRMDEVKAILSLTDPGKLLKDVAGYKRQTWLNSYNNILKDKKTVPDQVYAMRDLVKSYEDEALGDLSSKAVEKYKLALSLAARVKNEDQALAVSKGLIKPEDEKVFQSGQLGYDAVQNIDANEIQRAKAETDADKSKKLYTDINVKLDGDGTNDGIIQKLYRESVKERADMYVSDYDAAMAKLNVDPSKDLAKAKAKLEEVRTAIYDANKGLVTLRKNYDSSYKEADAYGVKDLKKLPPEKDMQLLLDKFKTVNDAISRIEALGPIMQDLDAMRNKINKAVATVNLSSYNNQAELTTVIDNLTKRTGLDGLEGTPAVVSANNSVYDVGNKLSTINDARVNTIYEEHVSFYIAELKKVLQDLKDKEAASATLVFKLGDANPVMPVGDPSGVSKRLAALARLYAMDFMEVDQTKFKGTYKELPPNEFNMAIAINKFYRACSEMLQDEKSEALMTLAEKKYNAVRTQLVRNQEEYLEANDETTFKYMSFKECLTWEIKAGRSSFAGLAVAEAYAEMNKIEIDPKEWTIIKNAGEEKDSQKVLRGLPGKVLDAFTGGK